MRLDILAIAAHPDDVELTCGGALIKMVEAGYKVGIVDLTVGESGTRGSVALRKRESDRASLVMGIVHRENLGLPDAGVEDRRDYKLKIAQRIRALQPRTVILPYWEGRHPDHYIAGQIGYEACFLAGLAKLPLEGPPHRPHKIIYASLYVPALPPPSWLTSPTSSKKNSRPSFATPRNSRLARIGGTCFPPAWTAASGWPPRLAISGT